MKKTLLSFLLLIVTLSGYSQDSLRILIPKQVGKLWCYDSTQIRQVAKQFDRSLYKDTLINLKDSIITIQKLEIKNLVKQGDLERQKFVKQEQYSHDLENQLDWQYSREVKRHIGWGLLTMVLLGLLISK